MKRVKLVNLTPHPIDIVPFASRITVPASGIVARVREVSEATGWFKVGDDLVDIPTITRIYGDVDGLPPPEEGVVYIASSIVAMRAWERGRNDVVSPGDPVRDSNGRVIGCQNLQTSGR